MTSFLNLIDIPTGREIRLAELGFTAGDPSFADGGIVFSRGENWLRFDLESGRIIPATGIPDASPEDNGPHLRFANPAGGGLFYTELVYAGRTLVHFMGSGHSIGSNPLSPDGRQIVFVGYPSPAGFGPDEG